MKMTLLVLFTLTVASEAFAQRRSQPSPRNGGRSGSTVVVRPPTRQPVRHVQPAPVRHVRHAPVRHVQPAPVRHVRPRVVGPRYNPPSARRHVYIPSGPIVRVAPRYVYNGYSTRYVRTVPRQPIVWRQPFGYTCNAYEQLMINGSFIHDFDYLGECAQAIQDIHVYGDFCDGEDLYDQSGALEAQFNFSYECRNALGWYY